MADGELKGRTAIITGASRGIGLGIARTFLSAGANVVITARKADELAKAADELGPGCSVFAGNAGDPDAIAACVRETVDRHGSVDVLVNNAATSPYAGPLVDIDLPRFDKTMQVNLRGPLVWIQECWQASMAEHGGSVVNVSSIGADRVGGINSAYRMSKNALNFLTRTLAVELAPRVRVNAISPGLVPTHMSSVRWKETEPEHVRVPPMARLGTVEDIAEFALFLAGDRSSWITGTVTPDRRRLGDLRLLRRTTGAQAEGHAAMTRAGTVRDDPVRRAALRDWLGARVPLEGELVLEPLSHGHSNEMWVLRSGDRRWVLRHPPRVVADRRASDMSRELTLLAALARTDVPHARAVGGSSGTDIIGTPFVVLEHVDGFSGHPPLPAPLSDPGQLRAASFDLIDVLVKIGQADWRQAGLAGFGRPEGFHERQTGRWIGQLQSYRTRDLPHLDEVAEWLRDHAPASFRAGLMHGDYGPRNALFARDRPGRIAAIVDWEQATIGDPLLDLGWLTAMWEQPGDDIGDRDPAPRFSELDGAPSRAELVGHYAKLSGADVSTLPYYQVLALFKLACVLEGSYARHLRGDSDDPYHATLGGRVVTLLRRAASISRGEQW